MTKKITFCDRCGKEMPRKCTKYYVTRGPYCDDYGNPVKAEAMDLCDKCSKDLERFMEAKHGKSDNL